MICKKATNILFDQCCTAVWLDHSVTHTHTRCIHVDTAIRDCSGFSYVLIARVQGLINQQADQAAAQGAGSQGGAGLDLGGKIYLGTLNQALPEQLSSSVILYSQGTQKPDRPFVSQWDEDQDTLYICHAHDDSGKRSQGTNVSRAQNPAFFSLCTFVTNKQNCNKQNAKSINTLNTHKYNNVNLAWICPVNK